MEVSVEQVRSDFADFPFIRSISFDADLAFQPQLLHKPAYSLVIDDISAVSHLQRYPTIAVSTLILVVDGGYFFFLDAILIRSLHTFQVVVIGASWNTCNL